MLTITCRASRIAHLSLAAGLALAPMRSAHAQSETRTISFTTSERTWMSVDVSPDGKTIVFDLLGDIYTLPIGGGRATRVTSGRALDAMPRWSHDGKWIVFS